jgi:hypothetical protein
MDAGLEVAGQVRDSTLSQPLEDRAAGLPESAPSAPQLSIHNRRIEHRSERAFPGPTPCAEVILIRPGSMYFTALHLVRRHYVHLRSTRFVR